MLLCQPVALIMEESDEGDGATVPLDTQSSAEMNPSCMLVSLANGWDANRSGHQNLAAL